MTETCEYVQVSGGKFHRQVDPVVTPERAFRSTETACGRTVRVLNYFPARLDALHYCGGREQWLCSQCERAS